MSDGGLTQKLHAAEPSTTVRLGRLRTSRRDELGRCQAGDWLHLTREPENPFDRMAVAVTTLRGVRVGYLARDRAGWIGSAMDRGYDVRAIVERVRGGRFEGEMLGLVVRLNMEGEEPRLPYGREGCGELLGPPLSG